MRSDLDAIRERHIRKETREELFSQPDGEWGWARAHVHGTTPRPPKRLSRGDELGWLRAMRPGTPEGGY
jgi:hypothetical protein